MYLVALNLIKIKKIIECFKHMFLSIRPVVRINLCYYGNKPKYSSNFFGSLLGSVGSLFTHHKLICVLMVLLLNALKILHQIPSCHTNDTFGFGPFSHNDPNTVLMNQTSSSHTQNGSILGVCHMSHKMTGGV